MTHVEKFVTAFESLVLRMQQIDTNCLRTYGDVTKREFNLLIMLGRSEKMIMREVADFLCVPVSTATTIIDKLDEKGYLKRMHSSTDRRTIVVALNEEGRSIYLSLRKKLKSFGGEVMNKLDENEKTKFIDLLGKVAYGSLE